MCQIPHPSKYVPKWHVVLLGVYTSGPQKGLPTQGETVTIYEHQGCDTMNDATDFCTMLFDNAHMVAEDGSKSFRVSGCAITRIN